MNTALMVTVTGITGDMRDNSSHCNGLHVTGFHQLHFLSPVTPVTAVQTLSCGGLPPAPGLAPSSVSLRWLAYEAARIGGNEVLRILQGLRERASSTGPRGGHPHAVKRITRARDAQQKAVVSTPAEA
jgi:hypothetical protein